MNKTKVVIVDFDDSFTFNILGILDELKVQSEVIHYKKYEKNFRRNFFLPKNIILGPGPGSPEEYKDFQESGISELIKNDEYNVMAICLGHQLLLSHFGVSIQHSARPMHGQQVELTLSDKWQDLLEIDQKKVLVQRYNSLSAKTSDPVMQKLSGELEFLSEGDEIFAIYRPGLISYQFHPESIGTNFSHNFFGPFLRNLL